MSMDLEREIGATGEQAYPVGWGVMPLSTRATRPDEAGALEVFKAALDAGVTFWDTSNAYCLDDTETGHNERLIAMAISRLGIAGQVHVTTKGGMTRPGGAWVKNGNPAHLRASCEKSLGDLGVEQIFLYQLHWPDPEVPYAESVGALADLQREGKVRHVGISNVSPEQFKEAQGIVRVQSVQNRCSPTDQGDFANGLVKLCEAEQVTYIPYGPMGGGAGHQQMAQQSLLKELAEQYTVSTYQIILAWLLSKSPRIIPIPGSSREASIRDSAAAARLTLDPAHLSRIDALG